MLTLNAILKKSAVFPELDLGSTQARNIFFISSRDQATLELTTAKVLVSPVLYM
jgi:hypothetical protein